MCRPIAVLLDHHGHVRSVSIDMTTGEVIAAKCAQLLKRRDAVPKRWIRLLLPCLMLVSAVGVGACGSKSANTPTANQPRAPPSPRRRLPRQNRRRRKRSSQHPKPPHRPPPSAMAPAALDELLAPIALYPDALLAQVLAAAAYPQEVMDGGNWLLQNTSLQGQSLQDAAKQAGFGPPMQALVMFPSVVDMMCQNFDWTKQLGSAFNADQAAVMASVQRLRAQAASVGNLKSTSTAKSRDPDCG